MPHERQGPQLFPELLHRHADNPILTAGDWPYPAHAVFNPGACHLIHWGDHHVLLHARRGAWWDANKIGLSPPPLETPEGWLIVYHGVRHTAGGCLYRLGLALLDLEDPRRVLRRSDEWIFAPEQPYERQGDVNGVVFPCGWVLDQASGTIHVYYGGADSCVALATAQLDDLMDHLRHCPAAALPDTRSTS